MMYKNLNETERVVFDNLDFLLVTLKERQGEKSFRKVLNLLREKYGN